MTRSMQKRSCRPAVLLRLSYLYLAVLIFGLLPAVVWSSNDTLDDFNYVMSVGVDNQSGSGFSNTPIAVQMQPLNLVNNDFLQADAEDWRPATVGGTALNGALAQGMTGTGQTWWVDIPSQADGAVAAYDFHMGNSTATRDQSFRVDGTTDTVTAADHADLDITDDLTLAMTSTILTWPSSETDVMGKSGAYQLALDQSGGNRVIFRVVSATEELVPPDSDVTIGDFTPTTCGAHFDCIDEAVPDGFGSYLSLASSATGEEVFGIGNTTGRTAQVESVRVSFRAFATAGSTNTIRPAICLSACATRTNGTAVTLDQDWATYSGVFTAAPGGGAWGDMASLDSLQVAYEFFADTGTVRMTRGFVEVTYSESAVATDDDASAALVVGTEYEIRGTYDKDLGSDNLKIYINGSQRGATDFTETIAITGNSFVVGTSTDAYVDDVSVCDTSVATPTCDLIWEFEPLDLAETQKGDSGNSWTWTGTVEDVSTGGSDHDGTYSLTRDMTDITTWTYNFSNKEISFAVAEEEFADLIGATGPQVTATQAVTNFFGRDQLEDVLEGPGFGISARAAWFLLLSAVGIFASLGVFFATRSTFLAALPLPIMYWVGWGMGLPIELWLPIIMSLVAFGFVVGIPKVVRA